MDSDWQNRTEQNSMNDAWVWEPVSWEWWQIIQLVLAILGILGNLLVMLVIFWPGRRRCATDILIGALAMADFLTSICIIPHRQVIQLPDTVGGELYCRIIETYVLITISTSASIFTLTTISIERLMAVRFPIWFQRLFSTKRTSIAVIVIWIAAFIVNIQSLYAYVVRYRRCTIFLPMALYRFLDVCLFILEYYLPVVIMVTSHAWTIYILRQRQATSLRQVIKGRVLQTLLIVVITFIICHTPLWFGSLVINFGIVQFTHFFNLLHQCFLILRFAKSCVNPFIYAARMPKFRKALMDLFMRNSIRGSRGIHSLFAGDGEGGTSDTRDTRTNATETFEA